MTSDSPPASIVVLISGAGTTMSAILDAAAKPDYGARVAAVVSDRASAPGLAIARAAKVPTAVVALADFPSREDWNRGIAAAIDVFAPDLIVLAGFMKILAPATVGHYRGRILNTHPALLPSFPGAHGVRDALAHGVKVTGCSVILVDDGVDTGPIVAMIKMRRSASTGLWVAMGVGLLLCGTLVLTSAAEAVFFQEFKAYQECRGSAITVGATRACDLEFRDAVNARAHRFGISVYPTPSPSAS